MWITTALAYLAKILGYGKASSFVIPMIISTTATGVLYFKCTISEFKGQFDYEISMLAFAQGGLMVFYFIWVMLNFLTGLQVASFRHREALKNGTTTRTSFIQVELLWKTLWKCLGILFLTIMITFLACLMLYMGSRTFYWTALWMIIALWVLGISYEIHSTGDNLKGRFGRKPAWMAFWDKVTKLIEEKLLKKINHTLDE